MVAARAVGVAQSAPGSAGRYELRGEIARGGMGVVFRAYDHWAEREIAYKRLLVEKRGSQARRAALFEREYNALARLAHPNIVQVYEYGIEGDAPYYTMELLDGSDLYESAPVPVPRACAVLREVASALSLIHARRLVHRDVSPVNVRLTPDGRAKLIDFGALARFGRAGEVVGTPAFIAPECLSGSPLDARTDLFSLGALAYWVLTRKRAFAAQNIDERVATLAEPVTPPSAHDSAIPLALDELVLSLLRVDPLERPATAAEVMERLTVIGDLPPEPNQRQVAYSYLAHPPLVGRDSELEVLRDRLGKVVAGQGGTFALMGAAGLGRTALLDQLAVEAQVAGATVLRGQGSADVRPFGVAQALVRAGAAAFPELLSRARVDSLSPGQTRQGGAASTPLAVVERHARILEALQSCFVDMAQEHPLVLLIDDAQHVDAESMAVLASLALGVPKVPVLIGLAVTDQAAAEASGGLAKLLSGADKLELKPLAPGNVMELVTSVFGDVPNARRLALWLSEHSSGNPAVCMDLSRMLLQKEVVQYVTGTFVLPHDILLDLVSEQGHEVSTAVLAELSAPARACAQVLALQKRGLSLELLAAAADLDGPTAQQALEELYARGVATRNQERVLLAQEGYRAPLAGQLDEQARQALYLKIGRLANAQATDRDTQLLAAMNLLRGGAEDEAVSIVIEVTRERLDAPEAYGGDVEVLEEVLALLRRRGRSDAQCLPILVRLARAGYFADYLAQRRNFEPAFAVLLKLTGLSVARRLLPFVGSKLALFLGLLSGAIRVLFTPRGARGGSFRENLVSLVSLAGSGVAAAVSAFEVTHARQIIDALRPFAAFPKGSAPRTAYEFTLATYVAGSGRGVEAAARFGELLALIDAGPIPGLEPEMQVVYRLACLYGQAQSELSRGSERSLSLADELQAGHPFYGPHAETTRMAYYAYRGDHERAQHHREQAELAALRGGVSWSAITIVTVRSMYVHIRTRNVMGLVRSIPELERLARFAPNLMLYRDLARAYLAILRGHADQAVRLYERVLADPRHEDSPVRWLDQVYYAEALCEVGRAEEAKRLCLEVLEQNDLRDDMRRYIPLQQLALAEAALGEYEAAAERLSRCLEETQAQDNPLTLGSLHRDRAVVALLARDESAFKEHLREMAAQYRRTNNPALIRQCEKLAGRARHAGLVVTGAVARWDAAAGGRASSIMSPTDTQATVVSGDGDLGLGYSEFKPTTIIETDKGS